MAKKNLLQTSTPNLMEILGNGKNYTIPKFQRDYSWNIENWEDLWIDMIELNEDNNPHYMGTIVLQSMNEDDKYFVVDGQQRLTTFTIIIVSIIKILKDLVKNGIEEEKNQERIEDIQKKFIGEKTLAGRRYISKLNLNKNNNNFFQSRILGSEKVISYPKLRDSEKLLYDGYNYFYNKLKEKFKDDDGEKISLFLEKIIAKKIIFIQINVDNDLDAYTVFETLNARGVDLTTTDLLKNYLFAIVGEGGSVFKELEESWQVIIDSVGLKTFPSFLRNYLNSRQDLVRKDRLFKTIKNLIQEDVNKVFDLINDLKQMSLLYNAIKNPNDDFWNENKNQVEIRNYLEEIKIIGASNTQFIPLLFVVYEKLPDIFHKILKSIVSITFRYNTIAKRNPNEMERVYNNISKKIYNEEIKTEKEILNLLDKIYVNDDDFKNIFSTKEISSKGQNKKLIKYIFTKIENHISSTKYDMFDNNITIEHILPENYSLEWDEVFEGNAETFVYRLGNYSILETKLNKKCGDKSFDEKKYIYKNSKIKLNNENIYNYDEWNIQSIHSYQNFLAKQAISIWKI